MICARSGWRHADEWGDRAVLRRVSGLAFALVGAVALAACGDKSTGPSGSGTVRVAIRGLEATLQPGATITLTAQVVNASGTAITDTSTITLSIADTMVATLTGSSLRAWQPGSTTVTAKARGGAVTGTATVTVGGAPVGRIRITGPDSLSQMTSAVIGIFLEDAGGAPLSSRRVTAENETPALATYTRTSGVVRAADDGDGIARIRVRSEGVTAVKEIRIKRPPLTGVVVAVEPAVRVGDSVAVAARSVDSIGRQVIAPDAALLVTPPERAVVRGGFLVGTGDGDVTVTAQLGALQGSTLVSVVDPDGFPIEIVYATEVSASAREAVEWAVARWREVLGVPVLVNNVASLAPGDCNLAEGRPGGQVVGAIFVVRQVELPAGTAGTGGVCIRRQAAPRTTIIGVLNLSASFVPTASQTVLRNLALHELGHAIGSGTTSNLAALGLADGIGGADPIFQGPNAVREFGAAGGAAYTGRHVPLANVEGAGSRDAHWRTALFTNEVMRFALIGQPMRLSRITIGQLHDVGYSARYGPADAFTVTVPAMAGALAEMFAPQVVATLENDIIATEFEVLPDGTLRRLAPRDVRLNPVR
jgi:hypothetical protein